MTKKIPQILAIFLGMSVVFSVPISLAKEKPAAALSDKAVELLLGLRDLWTSRIFWVRNAVLMTKWNESAGLQVAEDMEAGNARALADSITPFYGKDASERFYTLLKGHYGAVRDYMKAAAKNDSPGVIAAVNRLKSNADQIASFLNSVNPENWRKDAAFGKARVLSHRAGRRDQ